MQTYHSIEVLTAEKRIAEVAALLAKGLIRLRQKNAQESQFQLANSTHPSVHTNPSIQPTEHV